MTNKPAAQKKPAGKKIERQNEVAWWCPVCDHSNSLLTTACGSCGAVRDGDTVKSGS
jgi:uncharacterized protein (UPF0305 family)